MSRGLRLGIRINRQYGEVAKQGRNKGGVSVKLKSHIWFFLEDGIRHFSGVVTGFVQGFKSIISPTQQQQMVADPAQIQQPSNNTTNTAGALTTASPTTVLPSATSNQLSPEASQHPSNLPSPTDAGTSNQNSNGQLGSFNEAYPVSPPPIQSTSSGSPVSPILNDTNPNPLQTSPNAVQNGMTLYSHSTDSLDYISELDDSNTDAILGSDSDREPSEDGDGGEGGEEVFVDAESIKSFVYLPSTPALETICTCRLEGCSSPTFIDSTTDLESGYCSWKHQE